MWEEYKNFFTDGEWGALRIFRKAGIDFIRRNRSGHLVACFISEEYGEHGYILPGDWFTQLEVEKTYHLKDIFAGMPIIKIETE